MTPRVSAIIANYNGAHLLPECLLSLQSQDAGPLDVIVVDNGSIDDSADVAARHACRFVPLNSNHGLGAAYNRGAEIADGEFLFFVNNDMRFDRSCVRRLAEALAADAGRFAVDPLQYNWTGDTIIHARTALERIGSVAGVISKALIPLPPLRANYTIPCSTIVDVPWGCGGCLMVRRDLFEAIGGWDEKFFMDMEDVDLCWRAWMRGWPTVFVPSATLQHKWGASNDAELRAAKPEHVRRRLPATESRRLVSQQYNHFRFALKLLDLPSVAALVGIKLAAAAAYAVRRPAIAMAIARAMTRIAFDLPATLAARRDVARSAKTSSTALIQRFAAATECNVCGWRGRRFDSDPWHKWVVCPQCRSVVRHRLLQAALVDDARPDAVSVCGKTVLHFAPERALRERLRRSASRYVTADLDAPDVDMHIDLCDMSSIAPETFDVVIACDVLEHVADDRKAMGEMRRVLRPGGRALLTVPQKDRLADTYEDAAIVEPAARTRAFGQADHRRIYGDSFPQMLTEAGFHVTVISDADFPAEAVRRHVLRPPVLSTHPLATNYRKVFVATKPATQVHAVR